MEINEKKFNNIKEEAEKEYKKIGSVRCPYLKEGVAFNARGLEHIKFKNRNQARSNEDQYIRFRCLPLANTIIKASHTLQEFQKRKEMVGSKKGKWTKIMKQVEYFEFIAVIKEVRVRVIVKKVDKGEPHFWSIIPFWRTNVLGKRVVHNGNPSED